MKFKEVAKQNQFFSLHPKLKLIVCDLAWYSLKNYNIDITITSMIRVGDPGVHGDGRGCDVRSYDFTPEQLLGLKDMYNNKYPYGDNMHPTFLVHDVGQGTHIHLQVIRDGKS